MWNSLPLTIRLAPRYFKLKTWYGELNEYQLNWLIIEYMNFNILSYIYSVGDLSEYGVCGNWNRTF